MIRPEYSYGNNYQHVYIYFPAPEFFLLTEAEDMWKRYDKRTDKIAEFCADAGWTLEPSFWEREGGKIIAYNVHAAEVEDVSMHFGSLTGYISLAGNIEALEKAVELWSDLFDKNKAKGENRDRIETVNLK
ncbi:MAG: hypothetical protein AABX82_06945 [Nanoarchaeota archaeon]